MLEKLEVYFVELIQGKRKGWVPSLIKGFLRILSWFYQCSIFLRNWAYDHGCFKQYYAPVPLVISVGNIVAGGTGKTPATLMLAQEFYKDFTVAILSRGYRSKAEHLCTPLILSRGHGPEHPASLAGDEPYLLAQNLPKAFVFVGKNRHRSSNLAARAGAQVILLDDGMQHRHLARDFDVVLMNARDPFGQGHFIPRGFLREGLASLARADLIILNHLDQKESFDRIKNLVAKYTKAPLIGTRMQVMDVFNLQGASVQELKGKKVGIFCAIAQPENFRKTVLELGVDIVQDSFHSDHLTFSKEELMRFWLSCKAKGAHWILCTEKDAVKLEPFFQNEIPIAWVKMRLVIVEGESQWKKFTETAKKDLLRRL